MTNGAGGVIGLLEGGVIRNCINTGKVSGPERLGGIIGDALGRGDNCELYNCYNVGAIDGNSTLGGIWVLPCSRISTRLRCTTCISALMCLPVLHAVKLPISLVHSK